MNGEEVSKVQNTEKVRPVRQRAPKVERDPEAPIYLPGLSEYAGQRAIVNALVALAMSVFSTWVFAVSVAPWVGLEIMASTTAFVWPTYGLEALVASLSCGWFMVFLVAWWLLGPLVYMIPPKTELVTHWLFIHYSDRGPGVVVVFRPLEWPYREVSLQTNTKEYKDINTETADAIPVNMNAVLRWFITNSVKAATNVVGDIRNAMSGIAQPAIMEAAGAVTYDTLRAHKGDVTTEIRKRAQEELDRLDKQDRGMGVDVQIELQDTPISDPRVREAYSSPIEAAQRGKGLEAMIAPTIKYVLEQAAKYKEEFPKATAQDIIDLITSLRDSDAVEKTPAALVQRAIHAFGGGRIHPDSGEG